jgi:membrane-bound serine protease (ClpP class)
VIALVSRFLPESRLFKRLVLTESAGGLLETTPVGIAARQVKAGDAGQTLTAMRPYGTVEIGANRVEAVTEGAYLQAGTAVRVREINGTRIIVEEVAV